MTEDTKLTTSSDIFRIGITDRELSTNGLIREMHTTKYFDTYQDMMKFWFDENEKHYFLKMDKIETITSIWINRKFDCHGD